MSFLGIPDSVIGGGVGWALGGPIGGLIGAGIGGGIDTNQANQQIAGNQMAFQEDMSNTAYQRARADMVNAGLNPLLMAGSGGASTPTGASIQMQNPFQNAPSSAMDLINTNKDLEVAKAGIAKTNSDIDVNSGLQDVQKSQIEANSASAASSRADAMKTVSEIPMVRFGGKLGEAANSLVDKLGLGSSAVKAQRTNIRVDADSDSDFNAGRARVYNAR